MAESLDWDRLQELGWKQIGQADPPRPEDDAEEGEFLFPREVWTGHLPMVNVENFR